MDVVEKIFHPPVLLSRYNQRITEPEYPDETETDAELPEQITGVVVVGFKLRRLPLAGAFISAVIIDEES